MTPWGEIECGTEQKKEDRERQRVRKAKIQKKATKDALKSPENYKLFHSIKMAECISINKVNEFIQILLERIPKNT